MSIHFYRDFNLDELEAYLGRNQNHFNFTATVNLIDLCKYLASMDNSATSKSLQATEAHTLTQSVLVKPALSLPLHYELRISTTWVK